uniref:Putative ovule protein n=1 Tax=Solanum chacoense TaxID=4108 RepID=A0A0V0I390_SOLCH
MRSLSELFTSSVSSEFLTWIYLFTLCILASGCLANAFLLLTCAPYIPNLLVDFHYKHFILMLPVCNQIINLFINELLLYILGLFNSVSWKMSIVCSSSVRLLLLPTSFYSSKHGVPLWNLNM